LKKLVKLLRTDAVDHLIKATAVKTDIDKMFVTERELLKNKLKV
jgi:hypothetical protein